MARSTQIAGGQVHKFDRRSTAGAAGVAQEFGRNRERQRARGGQGEHSGTGGAEEALEAPPSTSRPSFEACYTRSMGNVPLANDPEVRRLWRETSPHGLSLVVWYEQVYLPHYNEVLKSASVPGPDGLTWMQKNEIERQRDRERHQASGSSLSYEMWCVEQYQLGWEDSCRAGQAALSNDQDAEQIAAPRHMFDSAPVDWRQLQTLTLQMFAEMGCNALESYKAPLVRGGKVFDVYVEDSLVAPPKTYAVECKFWTRRIEQEKIHAFRTVCADFGVNIGFLVAKSGFQSGAREAADRTNVQLVNFDELQEMFFDRWYAAMMDRLRPQMEMLFPYWARTGGCMPRFQWGLAECQRHQQLLAQYQIVLDVHQWLASGRLGTQPRLPRPLPRTFNDPRSGTDKIEVSTPRQYFTLVSDAYPRLLREMQVLHGETPVRKKTRGGREVLRRRRAKGRKRIAKK